MFIFLSFKHFQALKKILIIVHSLLKWFYSMSLREEKSNFALYY